MDVEKRRREEKEQLGMMIHIYCHGVHKTPKGTLCEECEKLKAYAYERTDRCPFMETKTFCSACTVHCYRNEYKDNICNVMRYAGPKSLFVHPIMAIKHVLVTIRTKKRSSI